MTRKPPLNPLITVLGATGTGKSKLAVELATKLNGEIINADAMQMYEGLDIITNKISLDERKGVRHHLLGCIGLDDEPWTVTRFTQKALAIIKEIWSRGRVPILVGGTHYYMQSLLFRESLIDTESPIDKADRTADPTGSHIKCNDPILQAPTPDILERLREVDPVMAERWHPNDRRRIQRSLEIYLGTGTRASDIYEEQSHRRNIGSNNSEDKNINQYLPNSEGNIALEGRGDSDIGVLEYPSRDRFQSLVFWTHAEHKILKPRLDDRMKQMVQDGLLLEVESLQKYLKIQADHGKVVDQTRGIWVSIGYKEFSSYLTALASDSASEKELESLEHEAIEQTKAATRQYAKRQVRWIRIKLINAASTAGIIGNVFPLDGNDLTQWADNVELPALNVAKDFLAGESLPDPVKMSPTAREMLVPKRNYDLSDRRDLWVKRTCDYCGKVMVTERDWERHVKSRGHRNAARRGMIAGASALEETR